MSTFISYSRADSGFAVRLAKDLKSAGYDVWLDQLDIPTGARWDDEVEFALEACTTFMVVLSPESIQSQNVKDEVGFAIDAGKNILPVKIKSGDIPFRLRRFQYVDFTNQPYEDSLKEMKGLLSVTGELLTGLDSQKKATGSEVQPVTSAPITKTRIRSVPKPKETGAPIRNTRLSGRLVIGIIAVAALIITGIVMNAARSRQSPAGTPTGEEQVVANTPAQQPSAQPTTTGNNEVSAPAQPTPSTILVTDFLESTNSDDWEYSVLGLGRRNKVNITPSGDGLLFNLNDPNLQAYYFYKPVTYGDVTIRIKVENLGQNSHNVSLVCRRSGDTWYEFRISGGGEWALYDYRSEYIQVANGGSQAVKHGKSINAYEMLCIGNEISLRINEEMVKAVNIQRDPYLQGQVGLSISTKDVYPIDMKVLEFEVTGQLPGEMPVTGDSSSPTTGIAGAPSSEVVAPAAMEDGMTMVLVPAGEFTMGSDTGEPNEGPAHTVFLDAFWIDRTEITNHMYATFLNSQGAQADLITTWIDMDDEDLQVQFVDGSWQAASGYENHPMIEIKWLGAAAYCEWRGDGTRLPSEAEWEKAARGTTDNLYAWGNEIDCSLANYDICMGSTVAVGSYPSNASPFGALDMTGNVVEWVADWYGEDYYQNSPSSNPPGPDSGEQRVLRGGSWDGHTDYEVRITHRFTEPPDDSLDDGGFRCVLPE
ncbi:MAG TPA: SUMF1/EgtB/PvdO family nonheme iron enzyme [Anaerolineales bacterium]|nr:SUMF1/EgtB/PvdO family nonheme iron enzyme [Anaerolineales bacterium]